MVSRMNSMLCSIDSPVLFTSRMCCFMGISNLLGVCLGTWSSESSRYTTPGRPKYAQNSENEIMPSLFSSMSWISRPRLCASADSSSMNGFSSLSVRPPRPLMSRARNSCRSSSSNSCSRDDRHAAANSRYSQESSLLMSSAAATFLAWVVSMPMLFSAATSSERSRTPLLSVSNFEKRRENLLMHVHPDAILRQSARCVGLRSFHWITALHRASASAWSIPPP
mmetsp:Transcript_49132/g.145026  ORF Transcript_49132/g.145026 Transcript_49132/m.145026 type:complete len:224 (+) Transcript_49132:1022-1693(+)